MVGLTQAGCNSTTSDVTENHDGHDHGDEATTESEQSPMRVNDVTIAPDADLEAAATVTGKVSERHARHAEESISVQSQAIRQRNQPLVLQLLLQY